MMRCPQAQRLLSLQRDACLSPKAAHALATHMATCAGCRNYEQTIGSILSDLNGTEDPQHDGNLARRAIAEWSTQSTVAAGQRSPYRIARPALVAAAGVTLVAAYGLTLLQSRLHKASTIHISQSDPHNGGTKVYQRTKSQITRRNTPIRSFAILHSDSDYQFRSQPLELRHPSELSTPGARSSTPTPRHPLHPHSPIAPVPLDDLAYVNIDIAAAHSRWHRMNVDETQALLMRLQRSVQAGDDFVKVGLPPIAGADPSAVRAAIRAYRQQAAIVDTRLQYRITLAARGVPLSDLCRQLSAETGIALHTGRTVADDRITVFCTKRPLRDLMRQITRLFGFTWLRDGEEGGFRYELAQDMRSQLLEEELRNQDRDAALLALDREMERYRKYLALSPEEARRKAAGAKGDEAHILNALGGTGWAPVHLYFLLAPDELRALRAGQKLTYGELNRPGERPLPPDLRANTLSTLAYVHIFDDGRRVVCSEANEGGLSPTEFPGSRAEITLQLLDQKQLDRFRLVGSSGVALLIATPAYPGEQGGGSSSDTTLAESVNAETATPGNAATNANLAPTPAMKRLVTVATAPSCQPQPDFDHWFAKPLATTADALEALHRATGQDIVADYYTRLYRPAEISGKDLPLFDILNQLCAKMRMNWKQDSGWLAFRSAGYSDDRLKEVPHRLLAQWADSHRKNGMLTPNDLVEIAQISDAQLESVDMAEGAWALYGLSEWDWMRDRLGRAQWRLLAEFSPSQLAAVAGPKGIPFEQMTLTQQQGCISLLTEYQKQIGGDLPHLEDFTGATLRVILPKPELLPDVPIGRPFSPFDYWPRFHYEYSRRLVVDGHLVVMPGQVDLGTPPGMPNGNSVAISPR